MKNLFICILLAITNVASVFSQKVNGVVLDSSTSEPVIGATVVVKGQEFIGTTTDLEGKFYLDLPNQKSVLIISYVGMRTQEVQAKENMKIYLEADTQQLEEVVVTGMQKMDKRLFSGAATKIDAGKAKLDGMADASRSLEGRVAGVSVQNVSGTFGTAPKIRVRGATSIFGNSKPLWVVDGVVMEDVVEVSTDALSSGNAETLISSAIAGLNADDIESFQILKDGSATSIYGARAMPGVIVVTTKKGVAGKTSVSYTGEFTTRMIPSYNNYNILNSFEQMSIYKEMEEKGWLEFASLSTSSAYGVYGKMYDLINKWSSDTGFGLQNTQEAKYAYLQLAEQRNTNWFNELFSTAMQQNHAVSISTGNERSRNYFSLSMMHDPGWTKQSKVQRYTANANSSIKLYNNLTLSLIGNASYRNQIAPGTLNQTTDIVTGEIKRDFDINPYSFALNTSRTIDPNEVYRRFYTGFNIFNELENNYIDLGVTDMKFQAELNYKPVRGLEIAGLAALRYQYTMQEHHIKDDSNQANAYRAGVYPEDATIRDNNNLLYKDPDDPNALPVSILPVGGIYNATQYILRSEDYRLTANYVTSFGGEDHIMTLFGGAEQNSTMRKTSWFKGWGYQYNNGGIPRFDYNVFKQSNEENTQYYGSTSTIYHRIAFFAMGTYSYKGKYSITGTGRYEGTNRLGKSRTARWLPTWNISGAWNAHEENWFKVLNPALSHMTLRMSYSLTADAGPASVTNAEVIFMNQSLWRPTADANESSMYIQYLANQDLTYEKKYEFNFGASLGFLNNRINLEFDVYKRDNFDLIGYQRTQGVGGEILKMANVASMATHGYELTFSTRNIITPKFTWSTDFIFSDTENKITELNSMSQLLELVSGNSLGVEGYPARSLFSIPFVGLNTEGLPVFINQDHQETITGINFQEYDATHFLKYEGSMDPRFTGSFNNTFTYKGFTLSAFITYSFGNVIRLDPVFSSSYSDLSSMTKEFNNRWRYPGDEKVTTVPVIASKRQNHEIANLNIAYNAYNYSTERVAKGDFIRLKDISLSYDFPKSWIEKIKLTRLQLKVQATNLCLLYADKKLNGQDPEFMNSGGVALPTPKQITFSIRLGL